VRQLATVLKPRGIETTTLTSTIAAEARLDFASTEDVRQQRRGRCVSPALRASSGSHPQTERATRLAELKPLGQQVDALRWTPGPRSACWTRWKACRHGMLAAPECCLVRVRKALQTIQRAAAPDPARSRQAPVRLRESGCSPGEDRALIWQMDNEPKAPQAKSSPTPGEFRLSTVPG
jgi:hypothetical protein